MLQDISPYDPNKFKQRFEKTVIAQQCARDFDILIWDDDWKDNTEGHTRRQILGDRSLFKTKFSMVPFYYLEYLIEKNPDEIYDLGCGWNIFKKYIPNVIGVSAEDPNSDGFYADLHDYVDDDYIKGHQKFFKSVFAINSLHYIPLKDLRQRVLDFGSMLRPGGRGWITFGTHRLLERDTGFDSNSNREIEFYIRQELDNLPFTVLQFEADLSRLQGGMDGNIRLIIESEDK